MSVKRAVVVDDDPQTRYLVQIVLESLGINKVAKADNGEKALSLIKGGDVAIVIMDWKMEVMDGLECTRRIRAGVDGIDPMLPILLVTAVRGDEAEKEAYAAGVDLFMEKPFGLSDLHLAIAKLIKV